MLNLFSNAVKYNKPQGSVDTGVEELSCDGKTAWYEFRIADTGIGMSGDFVKNQLFEPFTQEQYGARTRYQGTGLGMSIVKGLVEKMGGTIQVESVRGEEPHLPSVCRSPSVRQPLQKQPQWEKIYRISSVTEGSFW